jgi:hypothetical protein
MARVGGTPVIESMNTILQNFIKFKCISAKIAIFVDYANIYVNIFMSTDTTPCTEGCTIFNYLTRYSVL